MVTMSTNKSFRLSIIIVAILACGFSYRTFGIPSTDESSFHSDIINDVAIQVECVENSHALTVYGDPPTRTSFVSVLLLNRGPTTVSRSVVVLDVNSVNGVFGSWFRSHVFKEVLKTILPTVTNCDSTASVINIIMVLGIKTPTFHLTPRAVFARTKHSMFGGILSCLATTTHPAALTGRAAFGFPTTKTTNEHVYDGPTITLTRPVGCLLSRSQSSPLSESFSSQIKLLHVRSISQTQLNVHVKLRK